ncbi:D-methionine transport system ATP-binding protein [Atopostipes suicloacalis DSM 15692]|uniref:D-methionine transport system ATP-binding protein n=1 Tax=Atopostipes suicloacalis DSM 15692 TaxID=1121025 RepID=A0A1M4XU15_9LACT|nr:ATP-binding cassette domain-containing protein [Atopostipes suicloacalis]SHE96971.1 D-methionine transport system ATP-binding protein [Atopostipes suicloacalis DSM 15692]
MIELKNIEVTFESEETSVQAVKDVSLSVGKGDIYGIVGYSGAGKSTLVRTINLLQRPTAGEVFVNGQNLSVLSPNKLRNERKKIGMIFQHFNLMRQRTVAGNVAYPLRGTDLSKEEVNAKVEELLQLVGLADKKEAYPSQLSGGQKQRVAIARALANDPEVLLCDEATSSLDPKTTSSILELLKNLNKKLALTIVIITHEMEVVKEICNKVAVMEDGEVVEQGDLVSVFTAPKESLTQEFIHTATHIDQAAEKVLNHPTLLNLSKDDVLASITYVGETTSSPLVASLYARFGITTNILYGNVEILQNTPIGNLIVIFSGSIERREEAMAYLKANHVTVKIIEHQQEVIALNEEEII